MLKPIVLILSLLLTLTSLRAQTTEEEYNYMSKGYGSNMEKGLGNREGYKDEKAVASVISPNIAIETVFILRTKDNSVVGLVLIYTNANGTKAYHAIPHPKSSDEILLKGRKGFARLYEGDDVKPLIRNYMSFYFDVFSEMITLREKFGPAAKAVAPARH